MNKIDVIRHLCPLAEKYRQGTIDYSQYTAQTLALIDAYDPEEDKEINDLLKKTV